MSFNNSLQRVISPTHGGPISADTLNSKSLANVTFVVKTKIKRSSPRSRRMNRAISDFPDARPLHRIQGGQGTRHRHYGPFDVDFGAGQTTKATRGMRHGTAVMLRDSLNRYIVESSRLPSGVGSVSIVRRSARRRVAQPSSLAIFTDSQARSPRRQESVRSATGRIRDGELADQKLARKQTRRRLHGAA